jgi:hypothetical protein
MPASGMPLWCVFGNMDLASKHVLDSPDVPASFSCR